MYRLVLFRWSNENVVSGIHFVFVSHYQQIIASSSLKLHNNAFRSGFVNEKQMEEKTIRKHDDDIKWIQVIKYAFIEYVFRSPENEKHIFFSFVYKNVFVHPMRLTKRSLHLHPFLYYCECIT